MNRDAGAEPRIVRSPFTLALLVFSLVAILWICVRPVSVTGPPEVRFCLICGDQGVPNIVLNILLYAPLGLAVALRTGSIGRATLVGFLLSITIETMQLWIPGRFPGLADLFSNTLGAAVGGVLSRQRHVLLDPPPGRRRSMTLAWSAVLSAATVLPGLLLLPSIPAGDLYVGWTPSLGSLETYTGRVLSVRLDTLRLAHGRVPQSEEVRRILKMGEDLDIRVQVGTPPHNLAPLLHISTRSQNEVLLVGIESSTLVLRSWVRARDLRFAAPELRIGGLLDAVEKGDTVALSIRMTTTGGIDVTMADSVTRAGISAARGWSLLRYPRSWPDWALAVLDLLWVMLWFLPTGLWASSGRLLALGTALPVALALLACVWTPLQAPHMLHAAAVVAGLLAGLGLRRAAPNIVGTAAGRGSVGDSPSSNASGTVT